MSAESDVDPFILFPGLEARIDGKNVSMERSIRNWILSGIVANMLAVAGIAITGAYAMGTVSNQSNEAFKTIGVNSERIRRANLRIRELEIWKAGAEVWMQTKGYQQPPRPQMPDDAS